MFVIAPLGLFMMAGVKPLSGNFNIVSFLCWCLLIVFPHSTFQKAKIFLILGMVSIFQLYPGHLGYYYLTRLWILFILFQQASADTMPVVMGAPRLWHWVGWGLAPQRMGPCRLCMECSRNYQRGLSRWAALPLPALLGASSSLWVGIPRFQVFLGPARSERWQKRNAENSLLTALQVPVPYFSPPLRVILALKFPAGEIGKMCLFHPV